MYIRNTRNPIRSCTVEQKNTGGKAECVDQPLLLRRPRKDRIRMSRSRGASNATQTYLRKSSDSPVRRKSAPSKMLNISFGSLESFRRFAYSHGRWLCAGFRRVEYVTRDGKRFSHTWQTTSNGFNRKTRVSETFRPAGKNNETSALTATESDKSNKSIKFCFLVYPLSRKQCYFLNALWQIFPPHVPHWHWRPCRYRRYLFYTRFLIARVTDEPVFFLWPSHLYTHTCM